MNLDFNTADLQAPNDLIPANTIAKIVLTIRPGNAHGNEWLTASKNSDAKYLNCEFTVTTGPHAKRKFWTNLTVEGGKQNDKGDSIAGNISRSTLRAILESAKNIAPTDVSEEASQKRIVTSYGDFDGVEFACKIGIEKDRTGQFGDKNKIVAIITPDHKDYNTVMSGQEVAPPSPPGTGQAVWGQGQPPQTSTAPSTTAGIPPNWGGAS